MSPFNLTQIQDAIRREKLDGWLFWCFRHRDPLAESILQLPPGLTNSRPWLYAVPAEGEALRIVHAIEEGHLNTLPGGKAVYISREDYIAALQPLAGKRWGVHVSEELTAISFMDAGTASVLEKAGLKLVSAAGLVQRFKGLLHGEALKSHERAAAGLYDIVDETWGLAVRAFHAGSPLYEGDLRKAMLDGMEKRNLVPDHPPIVGAGPHSGDPHYDFEGRGSLIQKGDIVQFDLWAKEKTADSIYADISWVCCYDRTVPGHIEKTFADLVGAREGVLDFIRTELAEGRRPDGAAADKRCREILIGLGYGKALKHRTGHGIDTECHGSGVNIDSVEFPDFRLLLDGSCFSLEPGIYFPEFGLRTEINVYINNREAVVTGKDRQYAILMC